MSTNWQKTVNRINADRYSIPPGWDTKEQVAVSLQCDPARVNDILKPGIEAGEIERQEFPLWDEKRRLTTRVTCYREASTTVKDPTGGKALVDVTAKKKAGRPADRNLDDRVRAAVLRFPDKTACALARNLSNVSSVQVAEIRRRLKI